VVAKAYFSPTARKEAPVVWNCALVNVARATGLRVNALANLGEAFKGANTRKGVLMAIRNAIWNLNSRFGGGKAVKIWCGF